jgi:hypothetical protein
VAHHTFPAHQFDGWEIWGVTIHLFYHHESILMAFVARFVSSLASVRLPSGNQTKAIPFISEFVILTHLNP